MDHPDAALTNGSGAKPVDVTLPIPSSPWPRAIMLGLLFIVVVNMAFIFIAVSGADEVVPSYLEEGR